MLTNKCALIEAAVVCLESAQLTKINYDEYYVDYLLKKTYI